MLWKYKPKSRSLAELPALANLDSLELLQSNITTTDGLSRFPNLTRLEIAYAPKLTAFEDTSAATQLVTLEFDRCMRLGGEALIASLERLPSRDNLKTLKVMGCADLPSIAFVRAFAALETFVFMETNIVDGDISPTSGIDYAAFDNKRHYSQRWKRPQS